MESPTVLPLIVPLPRPARGQAERVRLGRAEIVLERSRGGYALLWSDGRDSRRYVLGLAAEGDLCIELRAPRLPVQLVPQETLTIVPGARLQGYVNVALVPTLIWRNPEGVARTLIELHPPELRGQWHEETGHTLQCKASWLVRFPFRSGAPQVVVPLRLYNQGEDICSPAYLPIRIADEDLTMMRGSVVVRPQRLVYAAHADSERPQLASVRPMPERTSEQSKRAPAHADHVQPTNRSEHDLA